MKQVYTQIVFQEVPDQISLALHISGCPLRCHGCHSSDIWNSRVGKELTNEVFLSLLNKFEAVISCVVFLGGEWHQERLIELLVHSHARGLKTCLYTGLEDVASEIKEHLDYLKTGPWNESKGGLESANTNQRFLDLKQNKLLNYRFQRGGNGQ